MSLIFDFQRLMRPINDELAAFGGDSPAAPGAPLSEEAMSLSQLLKQAQKALIGELLARVHVQPPDFFERLVLDVLVAMGYGSQSHHPAQRIGRSGDGGVDGLIALDELGLDLVYIQAKRLKPGVAVPVAAVRDFAGSLEARHALKGVFVTTTHFSHAAREFCSRLTRRVVLIDGLKLADLMVRHNIGVTVEQCYLLKGIDWEYFNPATARAPRSQT